MSPREPVRRGPVANKWPALLAGKFDDAADINVNTHQVSRRCSHVVEDNCGRCDPKRPGAERFGLN